MSRTRVSTPLISQVGRPCVVSPLPPSSLSVCLQFITSRLPTPLSPAIHMHMRHTQHTQQDADILCSLSCIIYIHAYGVFVSMFLYVQSTVCSICVSWFYSLSRNSLRRVFLFSLCMLNSTMHTLSRTQHLHLPFRLCLPRLVPWHPLLKKPLTFLPRTRTTQPLASTTTPPPDSTMIQRHRYNSITIEDTLMMDGFSSVFSTTTIQRLATTAFLMLLNRPTSL